MALHAIASTKYSVSNFDCRKFGLICPDWGIDTILLYLAIVLNTPIAIKATVSQETITRICCGIVYIPSPTATVIVGPLASSQKNSFKITSVRCINPTPVPKAATVIWLYQKKRIAKNSATVVIVIPTLN